MTFAHLHIHSEFSLLDGAIRIPELVTKVKELGMDSVALTDHGSLGGIIKFYKECKKQGIKSLIGCEFYLTGDRDDLDNKEKTKDNMHAVIIAKNNDGYNSMLKLSSEAYLRNFYYKPRVSVEKLAELKGNVICTSACLAGFLTRQCSFDAEKKEWFSEENRVQRMYERMCELLGKENIFLELQDWDDGSGAQPAWNRFMLQFSKDNDAECVITTDAHFLTAEDHEMHELMMAMQLGTTLDRYKASSTMRYGDWPWVKPPEMMLESAKKIGCKEAYYNTGKIAEICNVEIELGVWKPPTFNPKEAKDYKEFCTWMKTRQDSLQ